MTVVIELKPKPWDRKLYKCMRACEMGNIDGVFLALRVCRLYSIPLPEWLYDVLEFCLQDWVVNTCRGAGRHARWSEKHRQDLHDFAAYLVVSELRKTKVKDNVAAAIVILRKILPGLSFTDNSVPKACRRVRERIKKNPMQYLMIDHEWRWIIREALNK